MLGHFWTSSVLPVFLSTSSFTLASVRDVPKPKILLWCISLLSAGAADGLLGQEDGDVPARAPVSGTGAFDHLVSPFGPHANYK